MQGTPIWGARADMVAHRLRGVQQSYEGSYPVVPAKLSWPELEEGCGLEAGAQANEPIDCNADQKIDSHTGVHLKALVPERIREVRRKRKVINGVSYENCA